MIVTVSINAPMISVIPTLAYPVFLFGSFLCEVIQALEEMDMVAELL